MGTAGVPLPDIALADIDGMLQSFASLLNCLESHYNSAAVLYEKVEIGGGGAGSLLHFLERGLNAERQDQARF